MGQHLVVEDLPAKAHRVRDSRTNILTGCTTHIYIYTHYIHAVKLHRSAGRKHIIVIIYSPPRWGQFHTSERRRHNKQRLEGILRNPSIYETPRYLQTPIEPPRTHHKQGYLCFIVVVCDRWYSVLFVIYDRLHPVRMGDRAFPPRNGLETVLVNCPCRSQLIWRTMRSNTGFCVYVGPYLLVSPVVVCLQVIFEMAVNG